MICTHPIDGKSHITCGMCEKLGECGGSNTMLYNDKPFNTIPMPKVKPPKDDFLDAEDAYKATNKIIGEYDTTEIQDLKDHILDAIKDGKFSFTAVGELSDLAKEYLKNKNYKIEIANNKYLYTVSWGNIEGIDLHKDEQGGVDIEIN